MTVLCVLLSLLMMLCSCAEEVSGTGTMTIMLFQSGEKTISPDQNVETITKYIVRGTGPGGKTFTRNSTSSTVVMDGLPLGHWELSAGAYSSKSKELANGNVSVEFDSEQQSFSLGLERIRGSGSAQLRIDWDSSLSDVKLFITLSDSNGKAIGNYQIVPTPGSGYTTWTSPQVPDGSYSVSVSLYSSSSLVCGTSEAVKIVADERTTGNLNLTSDSEWDTGKVSFKLEGLNAMMASSQQHSVSLIPQSNIPDFSGYSITWYLDSVKLTETGPSVVFTPSTGSHVLSAVIVALKDGSIQSVSGKFTSKPQGASGLATFGFSITNGLLGNFISAVNNDSYVSINTETGVMTLFKVASNTIQVLDTVKATDLGWEWLGDTNGLWGNAAMSFFATADEMQNISILHVNSENRIEMALYGENDERIKGSLGLPLINLSGINNCSTIPTSSGAGSFLFFPPSSRALVETTDSSGISSRCGMNLPSGVSSFAVLEGRGANLACAGTNSDVLWYAAFDGIGKTTDWYSTRMPLSRIKLAKFLTEKLLLVSDGDAVVLCTKGDELHWKSKTNVSTRACDIKVYEYGPYFYVLESPDTVSSYMANGTIIRPLGTAKLPFQASYLTVGKTGLIAVAADGSSAYLEIIFEE